MKIQCTASMYREVLAAKGTFEQISINGLLKADREAAKAKVEVLNWLLFQFDFQQLEAELKELQNIADKWTDPKTQEELYLGRCVKAAYAKGFDVNASVVYTSDRFKTLDDFIEWGKQQGVE